MRSISLYPAPTMPANPKTITTKPSFAAPATPGLRFTHTVRAIASPEPPWLVPSPMPHPPFDGKVELVHHRLNSSSAFHKPISLRRLQQQKKSLSRRHRPNDASTLNPIGRAAWALICLLEELLKSSFSVGNDAARVRVFWDSTEPLVWLFLRVFSASPNLLVPILALSANFVAGSVERCVVEAAASAFNSETDSPAKATEGGYRQSYAADFAAGDIDASTEMGIYGYWADIGILDESDVRRMDHSRRRWQYESMIVREKHPNSLILSNYAQFLYQIESDLERAQEYFKLAVVREPADGEAMNKYAGFLWKERGDIAGAEEMFLKAIEADPLSSYLQSCYASFLFLTGGDETCFPLNHSSTDESHAI